MDGCVLPWARVRRIIGVNSAFRAQEDSEVGKAFGKLLILWALVPVLPLMAQSTDQTDQGFGPVDTSAPATPPDKIVQQFAAKESEFRHALDNYTYQRDVRIQTINDDGKVDGEYRQVVRYEFQPVGDSGTTGIFYVYVSHMKSGTTSADATDRGEEANGVHVKDLPGLALRPFNGRPVRAASCRASFSWPLLAVLMARRQGRAASCRLMAPGAMSQLSCVSVNVPSRTRPVPARADTIFQTPVFSGLKVASSPCRPNPLSYMRLTVAISRVFDLEGVRTGRRQGPANLPQKRG